MAASITVTPASGSITAKSTVCRFDIENTETNDTGSFDGNAYPTSPEFRYVLRMTVGGNVVGQSQVFGTTPDGDFQFNDYIFPETGTYTVQLYDVTDPDNESSVSDPATVVVA
jgi:hypothetical protein